MRCCALVHAATPLAVFDSENGITLYVVVGIGVAIAGVAGTAVIKVKLATAVTRLKLTTSTRTSKTFNIFFFINFISSNIFMGDLKRFFNLIY